MNIIEVENLGFDYGQKTILQKVCININKGTFLGIIGPNGAGKTTLLNLLCGLLKPKTGSIQIDSKSIESYHVKELARKIAVVRQEFVPVFDFSVTEIVSMARTPYLGSFAFPTESDRQIIVESLELTDTAQFADRLLGSLSGGERQRVFIARALAQNTPILLLDEPTSFLDMKHQVGIYDLLKNAQFRQYKTIIAVTHDINLAAQYCDEILLLFPDQNYKFGSPKEVLVQEQISKVFGVEVMKGEISEKIFFIPKGNYIKNNK
ncbi:MAG: ABC transporter ATP-binding protein [Sedimentisphaerales bacterium]|nr:ABC transporter ATP-binding protein [Sedimentisphaerales bacterium]